MKSHFLLLICLCGCTTYRHNQDIKWNSDYSWVNWPTNIASPQSLSRNTSIPPAQPLTLAWDYSGPVATFNLYQTLDLKTWSFVTNTVDQSCIIYIHWPSEYFYVTATNSSGESVPPGSDEYYRWHSWETNLDNSIIK